MRFVMHYVIFFLVEQLVSIIIDLFLAGGDTTKNSIGNLDFRILHIKNIMRYPSLF